MIASLKELESPVRAARAYLENEKRDTPLLAKIMLEEYDFWLRGKPTPYLDRFPELKQRVEAIHRHFQRRKTERNTARVE